jgi:hypothetical protein
MASLVVAGCRASEGSPPEATVPTAPSTSLTTAPIDVSVIPPVIDEPYLNAVLAALDEVDGEASRTIVAAKSFTPEAADLLNAIYSDERFQVQAEVILSALAKDPALSSVRPNPGPRTTSVERIITASPTCVWMAVKRDHSASSVHPVEPRTEYVALRPLDESNDPQDHNPTAWMISAEGFNADGSEPGNQCEP